MTRLHIVGFPHTKITPEFFHCAYSAKISKFCRMMADRHQIFLYVTESSDANGAELVEVLSNKDRLKIFGPDDPNRLPAWPNDDEWKKFNTRTVKEIKKRAEPHDLVMLTAGWSQRAIMAALPGMLCIEPGVGYEGILTGFCSFESAAWRHYLYGKAKWGDGRWYDTVIPNYFDPAEFEEEPSDILPEYLLYVGRLIQRKGVQIAADVAQRCGLPLVVAGAGGRTWKDGKEIVCDEMTIRGPVHYIGPVGVEERATLMAGALAIMCPTHYIEPFCGVAVEGMMSGCPAVTSSFGAFAETVVPGVSGYHMNTIAEGVEAVEMCRVLDRDAIRQYANSRYALDAVVPQFERWFKQLDGLWGRGFYEPSPLEKKKRKRKPSPARAKI